MGRLEKLVEQLEAKYLEEGEKVDQVILGAYETKIMGNDSTRTGILAATNHRLIFYAKKLTGYDMEVFPYAKVSSIEMGKNMMGHHIRFFASGNKVSIKWIRDPQIGDFVSYVKQRIEGKVQDKTQSTQEDVVGTLERLAKLKKQGILTEEEFAAKKRQILGL